MSSVLRKSASPEAWDQWVDGLHEALAESKRIVGRAGRLNLPESEALMRAFHRIKGSAQALGLHGVQRVAHDLESRVLSNARFADACADAKANDAELRETLAVGVRKLDAALARLHELQMFSAARREVHRETLSDLFARVGEAAHGIAAELGQKLRFEFSGTEDPELTAEWETALEAALLHAARNSIDHGATERGSELALSLSARREDASLVIECFDTGAGIDPGRVREAARARHARFDAEMGGMSDSEVLQLLFLPGLSLSRGVSNLSGRGYGLDIVREAIETRLRGKARIESVRGRGTRLIFRIPLA
jgi:chemotaxis protein histidine kinase CheA